MALKDKIVIRLSTPDRESLDGLLNTSTLTPAERRRANILLLADADGPHAWTDEEIAEHLETTDSTVRRIRLRFASEGLTASVRRKRPTGRQYRKLDGKQEAQLIALVCSKAPDGHARWTMKLLADKLVEMEVVESIDPATVCRTLKKMNSNRGSSSSGSSRRRRVRHS